MDIRCILLYTIFSFKIIKLKLVRICVCALIFGIYKKMFERYVKYWLFVTSSISYYNMYMFHNMVLLNIYSNMIIIINESIVIYKNAL